MMASSSAFPVQESQKRRTNRIPGWPDLLLSNPKCLRAPNGASNRPGEPVGAAGYFPCDRPIDRYLRFGIINLEKPLDGMVYDRAVKDKIKQTLKINKAIWDDMATRATAGNYIAYLGHATTLILAPRVYNCDVNLHSDETKIREAVENLIRRKIPEKRGPSLFIHNCVLLAYFPDKHLAKFRIYCGHGTRPANFFGHLGENLGVACTVRRVYRGLHINVLGEQDNMVTVKDVENAQRIYEEKDDDIYLKKKVMPLEVLLMGYKRLMVNDSGVHQICVDRMRELTVKQLLKFEEEIESGEDVVLITANGEAIAIGFAYVDSEVMATAREDRVLAEITTMIMDQDPAITRHKTLSRNRSNSSRRHRRHNDVSEGRGGQGTSWCGPSADVSVPRQHDSSPRRNDTDTPKRRRLHSDISEGSRQGTRRQYDPSPRKNYTNTPKRRRRHSDNSEERKQGTRRQYDPSPRRNDTDTPKRHRQHSDISEGSKQGTSHRHDPPPNFHPSWSSAIPTLVPNPSQHHTGPAYRHHEPSRYVPPRLSSQKKSLRHRKRK